MTKRAVPWAVVLVSLFLGAPHALAQGYGEVEANIPFQFMVGDRVLAPGDYIVDVAGDTGPSVLILRAKNSGERIMLDTDQLPGREDPKAVSLIFDKIGDKLYLMEVWGVENSGRGVKHIVDGEMLARGSEDSRQRVGAVRVVSSAG